MNKLEITLFVESKRISTSCADIDSLGHLCANPRRTGAYDRLGSEAITLEQEQRVLLDAVIRACETMKWKLVIEDVSKWGFLKKLQSKGTIPRLEAKDKILIGTPTSDEVIRFFNDNCRDESLKIPSS